MSAKRPGTVDYSKWDHFGSSDSESDDDDHSVGPPPREEGSCGSEDDSDYDSEEGSGENDESESEDSEEDNVPAGRPLARRTTIPMPTLTALQRAWNVDVSNIARPCANCFSPDAPYRCSRCRLVRYCDLHCQGRYHPIHRLECIDAAKHNSYWGIFGGNKKDGGGSEGTDLAVLRARRSVRRRRALQRAAAAAAVERARNARVARGGVAAKGGGGGKGKGAEEREEDCTVCLCEFTVQGDGGVSFCCPSSHYICHECSGVWVNSVMSDLDSSYPPKCPSCKALMSIDLFERQLTAQQQKAFRAHAARVALKPGEELIECKECGLFEVVSDDPVLWWCPHCECGSCRVCNKDLPQGAVKFDIAKSEHHVCAKLRKPKALIEEAIEEGSKMRCPSCKLAGRKDEACTHMSCTKCSTEWCYVCGLSVVNCDKAPPSDGGRVNDIYLHNRDWETNEMRCPMYLTQVLEIDLNWLGENWEENARDEDFNDDERCLDYLHRFRTIKLLQGVREKIGDKAFIGAFVSFDSIKNCGYTYNEVVSTDTEHLIDRSDFFQHGENDDGQGDDEDGEAFANDLEQRQIDGAVDPDELEQRLVSEAIERSTQSAVEDDQIREAMARSADDEA